LLQLNLNGKSESGGEAMHVFLTRPFRNFYILELATRHLASQILQNNQTPLRVVIYGSVGFCYTAHDARGRGRGLARF
jgi:hypothetical protein